MTRAPTLDDIFAVISAASAGSRSARVAVPSDAVLDDPVTKVAIGLNLLLDDLAVRAAQQARVLEELRYREMSFRLLFADNPLPMWVYDLATLRFVEVNDAAVSHYGYTRDEFLQMRITDIRPPEDVPRLLEDLSRSRPTWQWSKDWRHRLKDGTVIDVEIASHLFTSNGRDAVLVVSTDVTERKHAAAALREREQWLSSVYNTVADVIFHLTVEPDGGYRFASVNQAFCAVTGLAYDQVVGKRVDEIVPQPSLGLVLTRYQEAIQERKIVRWEEASQYPTGQLTGEVSVAPVFDAAGKCTHLVGAVHDITERKRFEADLEALLTREQAARAEAQDAQRRSAFLAEAGKLLSASLDHRTTLANAARAAVPHVADWAAVDMIKPDGSLDRLAVAHTDPAKVEMAYELQRRYPSNPSRPGPIRDAIQSGKPVFVPEIPPTLLDSADLSEEQRRLLQDLGLKSYIVAPIVMAGRIVGLITLVTSESGRRYVKEDLEMAEEFARRAALAIENAMHYQEAQSLNLELERRVADRTAELEAANSELEAFSYSVAHDLRAPLRAIDGFSRIVAERHHADLQAETRRYLKVVRENAQQMGRLIDDLLTLSRLSRTALRRQPVEPHTVVEDVLRDLESDLADRTIDLRIGDLPGCEADANLLKQLYMNLLSNAVKFTRHTADARIEVGSIAQDGKVVYFVKDNGVGFDMRYADKLFQVFQRLHRSEEYEGTGVGLAIVQRIAHRHGGRVWAESEIDRGATFYFTLGGTTNDE